MLLLFFSGPPPDVSGTVTVTVEAATSVEIATGGASVSVLIGNVHHVEVVIA